MKDKFVLLQRLLLDSLPRTLALLDKNPYSKTFGSFDRKFWHYKIIDFSSGMQQELILPLAYVWSTSFDRNQYYQCDRIRQYIQGVFRYHGRMCHADGSLDDYFPHERAFGATAYALVALTEAALRTGLHTDADLASFERSGHFIATYREAGKLSNHLAIAVAALHNLHRLTRKESWKHCATRLADTLLHEQHSEGWFPEYEGCDPGYQTVTIEFLARAVQSGFEHPLLASALDAAVDFLRHFVHPDGSLGGEYGSRNTYNFYPGGFAILAPNSAAAREILFAFFKGFETGAANHLVDDGVFQHFLSSYVTTLSCPDAMTSEWNAARTSQSEIRLFSGAQLFTIRTGNLTAFGALSKGGVYKVFKGDRLIASDTGFMARLANGKVYCQNKANNANGTLQSDRIHIRGHLKSYKSKTLSRIHMIGLRTLSLLFGRFSVYSHAIRRLMQQVLIYDNEKASISFERTLTVADNTIRVQDTLTNHFPFPIKSLHRTTDSVNMHVVTSNSFQLANLLDWESIPVEAGKHTYALDLSYAGD
jgi:hypothetical protein